MWFNGELFEIFSWLPAKYLYKFSTICRTSNQLLFEDCFIKKQCKNMRLVGDTYFFLQCDCFPGKLELHAISSNNSGENRSCAMNLLPSASLDFVRNRGSIVASSNGLLCCQNGNKGEYPLSLFNPTTRSHLPIPTPDKTLKSDNKINLVFTGDHDEESFDYFLMVIVIPDEWNAPFQSKIYSPEENIWRKGGTINTGPRNMCFEYSLKHNGTIYLISDTGKYLKEDSPFYWPYVVAYDINKSSSRFFKIPMEAWEEGEPGVKYCPDLQIFEWGSNPNTSLNSICLVKLLKNVFTVWVLNRSTDVEETNTCSYSWSLVLNMPIKAMGLSSLSDDTKVTGFIVLKSGILLFATDREVYSCKISAKRNNVVRVERVCEHGCGDNFISFRPFSSTLRPCGPLHEC